MWTPWKTALRGSHGAHINLLFQATKNGRRRAINSVKRPDESA
jgi:hypothetical protein